MVKRVGGRVDRILLALPPGLHLVGAERFGPGLAELAEGLEAWTASSRP